MWRDEAAALDEQANELRFAASVSSLPPSAVSQTRSRELGVLVERAAVLRHAAEILEERRL